MATKKELVEAHTFSRRRLVTAFVSGAPGGREVEPARPGRTIIGGVALSVLLLAGAAVSGFFTGRQQDDWAKQGIVLAKDSVSIYVIPQAPEENKPATIYPVINAVSARLVLGQPDPDIIQIDQKEVAKEDVQTERGIAGAPATLPQASDLVNSGWTACTANKQGIRLRIFNRSAVTPAPDKAFVVKTQSIPGEDVASRDGFVYYMVVPGVPGAEGSAESAHALRLPDDQGFRDYVLDTFELGTSNDAPQVDQSFVDLLPEGYDLSKRSLGIEEPGVRFLTDGTTSWLDIPTKGLVTLDDFTTKLARVLLGRNPEVVENRPPGAEPRDTPWEYAGWPEALPSETFGSEPCLRLVTEEGGTPLIEVAEEPEDEASALALEVPSQRVDPEVQQGKGAYVLATGYEENAPGRPYLIDTTAKAYEIQDITAGTWLGLPRSSIRRIPEEWMTRLERGPLLSQDAARCPPDYRGSSSCDFR